MCNFSSLSEHCEDVTCVDWDLGRTRLYSGSKDKHVMVWDVDAGESIRSVHGQMVDYCRSSSIYCL